MPNKSNQELDINHLVVSFRTNKGIVHAVRNIDLHLEKGETLAIVGESGSGKSVSAKAILGIEAPNAIIEDGEILYQGQNLLTFTEEEYNRIRGNKITMIFQDPMSSLDPIVKIGPQMTEATLLNGRLNQKMARREFNGRLKMLEKTLDAAGIAKDKSQKDIAVFKKFTDTGSKLLADYNKSLDYADSIIFDIQSLTNDLLEEDKHNIKEETKLLRSKIENVYSTYFVTREDKNFASLVSVFDKETSLYVPGAKDIKPLTQAVNNIAEYLKHLLNKDAPNFFTLGYYICEHGTEGIDFSDVKSMNDKLRSTIDSEFMNSFISDIASAIKTERARSRKEEEEALSEAKKALEVFDKEEWNLSECKTAIKSLCTLVDHATNTLALHVDRAIYTLRHTLTDAVNTYKSTPMSSRTNAIGALNDLISFYGQEEKEDENYDEPHELTDAAVSIIDRFKDLSYSSVYHVTKQMAYDKAIRIMEEVGIRNPRERFNQYPFEFSGGMRQRIVIAIAIAANPDLLICDEPTTALDVTIQAQILELINKLKKKRNMSVIFITHDLGVVANVADKIAVMYAGKIVEKGTVEDIFYHPAHPYTWALLASMPDLDTKETLEAIPGTPPNMIYPPKGDAFAARNKYAMAIDYEEEPPMFKISETHYAATWLLHPDAPKVEPPKTVTDRIARMKAREEAHNA